MTMSIKLMKRIDFWVGVPLCFFLTGIHYVSKSCGFYWKRENTVLSPRVLFVKLSEMGSIILALPLIRRVREDCKGTEIFFLSFEANRPLLEALNIVPPSNILTIREKSIGFFVMDTISAIKRLRTEKMDIVFDLEFFSRFTALLSRLTGAPKRVGFFAYSMEGLYRGNLLTHKVHYNLLLHVGRSFLSLWQASKGAAHSTPGLEKKIEDSELSLPRFIPSQDEHQRMWQRLKRLQSKIDGTSKLFLLNPGEGTIPLREWPLDNFATLIKRLLEDRDHYLIIVGAEDSRQKAELLCQLIKNEKCIDQTAQTTIPEFLTLCSIGTALIANDCGLAHLASLTPIKKFILFGPESPRSFSPLGDNTWTLYSELPCSPCLSPFNHRTSSCMDNRCLKAIHPDSVYKLIRENLSF